MRIDRKAVYDKYWWLCAYTWQPLGDDWQVDHVFPKYLHRMWSIKEYHVNDIENLLPAIRIVNHYKRGETLEWFRKYMLRFHERLRKLPKKTSVPRTAERIKYMNKVAEVFWITAEKPFSWVFFFENPDLLTNPQ